MGDSPAAPDLNQAVVTATADVLIANRQRQNDRREEARRRPAPRLSACGCRRADAGLIVSAAYRPAHVAGSTGRSPAAIPGTAGSPVIITPTRADGTNIEAEMTICLITEDVGAVTGVVASLRPGRVPAAHRVLHAGRSQSHVTLIRTA